MLLNRVVSFSVVISAPDLLLAGNPILTKLPIIVISLTEILLGDKSKFESGNEGLTCDVSGCGSDRGRRYERCRSIVIPPSIIIRLGAISVLPVKGTCRRVNRVPRVRSGRCSSLCVHLLPAPAQASVSYGRCVYMMYHSSGLHTRRIT